MKCCSNELNRKGYMFLYFMKTPMQVAIIIIYFVYKLFNRYVKHVKGDGHFFWVSTAIPLKLFPK